MKRFVSVVSIVVVLVLLVVATSFASPTIPGFSNASKDRYVQAFFVSDLGEMDISYAEYGLYGEAWSTIFFYGPNYELFCYVDNPAVDVQEVLDFKTDGVIVLDIEIPGETCFSYSGEPVDTFRVNMTLTAENVYHGTYHSNVVKGPGQGRNCQQWEGYPVQGTGTIADVEVSYAWGSMMDEVCQYNGRLDN